MAHLRERISRRFVTTTLGGAALPDHPPNPLESAVRLAALAASAALLVGAAQPASAAPPPPPPISPTTLGVGPPRRTPAGPGG